MLSTKEMIEANAIFVVTYDHIRWIENAVPASVFERNSHKIRLTGADIPDPWFFTEQAMERLLHLQQTVLARMHDGMTLFIRHLVPFRTFSGGSPRFSAGTVCR